MPWSLNSKKEGIPLEREKEYEVKSKDIILRHKFYADFVVFDKIILEVNGVSGITEDFTAQCLNYLKVSGSKLVLHVNFGELRLKHNRIVL